MRGVRDDELAARWVQLGVFSPIMRLHSTSSVFTGKEPWKYGLEAQHAMVEFMRLRKKLVPYIYSMNYLTHREGLPLIRPMYYESDCPEAYSVPNEYMFGTQMIACPITKPADRETRMGAFGAWLPEGIWFDLFNGRVYRGGRTVRLHRTLSSIPVLVPAGGIIPLDADGESNGVKNPETVELRVYPGADGHFEMYEDSGVYGAELALTRFELSWGETARLMAEVSGDNSCIPENRRYKICVMDVSEPENVSAESWTWDAESRTLTVELDAGRSGFDVRFAAAISGPDPASEVVDILSRAQMSYDLKNRIYYRMERERDTVRILSELAAMELRPEVFGAVTEPLTAWI